ncbi:unnamed protein product, partial [Rotaria magnacalcarata]
QKKLQATPFIKMSKQINQHPRERKRPVNGLKRHKKIRFRPFPMAFQTAG